MDYNGKIYTDSDSDYNYKALYKINKSSDKNFLKFIYDDDPQSYSLVNIYLYKNNDQNIN